MRTLSRKRGSRTSLEKNLLTSLVLHGRITTTEAKAKHIMPKAEQLLTRAKQNDLSAKRHAATLLNTSKAIVRLFNVIVPALPSSPGGYISLIKTTPRVGDAAPVAVVKIAMVEPKKNPSTQTKSKTAKK